MWHMSGAILVVKFQWNPTITNIIIIIIRYTTNVELVFYFVCFGFFAVELVLFLNAKRSSAQQ